MGKMFNGMLDENDYADEDVRTFLNLLQHKDYDRRTHHVPFVELE